MYKEDLQMLGLYFGGVLVCALLFGLLMCLLISSIPEFNYNVILNDGMQVIHKGNNYSINDNGDLTIYENFVFPIKTYMKGSYTSIEIEK